MRRGSEMQMDLCAVRVFVPGTASPGPEEEMRDAFVAEEEMRDAFVALAESVDPFQSLPLSQLTPPEGSPVTEGGSPIEAEEEVRFLV